MNVAIVRELAGVISAVSKSEPNRPIIMQVDGKTFAEIQAGNNRTAIGERNRQIALGVGLK